MKPTITTDEGKAQPAFIPIEQYNALQAQFNNQMKHKESIKQYWMSCAENKAKWVEAIKDYLDSEHAQIKTLDEFIYQYDLD